MKAIRLKMAAGALVLWLAGDSAVPAFSQQIDPALTGAVTAQTLELKSLHDKRRKTQEKIIAAEAAVTVALDRVHSVEDKMLEYLSNAQGAVQNLYQIKRAGELVTTEIPQNCSLLLKSVGSNLKGTAIAAIVSDELTDAATQMAALYLQPAAQIGGEQPQGHGDSGHRVGRADGRGHADGRTLSVHETARDFG